jgi:hypothetical protein
VDVKYGSKLGFVSKGKQIVFKAGLQEDSDGEEGESRNKQLS